MTINLDAFDKLFQKRLAEIKTRTYKDASGVQVSYYQDGHAARLVVINAIPDKLEMLKAAHSLLTTGEKRASIHGRINRLPAEQRESYIKAVPPAGSHNELEVLVGLTIPLNLAIKINSVQSKEAENAALVRGAISPVQGH